MFPVKLMWTENSDSGFNTLGITRVVDSRYLKLELLLQELCFISRRDRSHSILCSLFSNNPTTFISPKDDSTFLSKVRSGMGHNSYGELAWPNDLLFMFPITIMGTIASCIGLGVLDPTLIGPPANPFATPLEIQYNHKLWNKKQQTSLRLCEQLSYLWWSETKFINSFVADKPLDEIDQRDIWVAEWGGRNNLGGCCRDSDR